MPGPSSLKLCSFIFTIMAQRIHNTSHTASLKTDEKANKIPSTHWEPDACQTVHQGNEQVGAICYWDPCCASLLAITHTGVNFNIANTLADKCVLFVCACLCVWWVYWWWWWWGGADRIENSVSTGPPDHRQMCWPWGVALRCSRFIYLFFISHLLCEYQREIKMKSVERMQDARYGVCVADDVEEMCETGLVTSASLHSWCNWF